MCFTTVAQDCSLPILSKFENPTTSGFSMFWIDFNNDIAYYEIELGTKGFSRTFQPSISQIQDKTITLDQLNSGTTYEIYIRSICNAPDTSLWNGPYFYNTVIDNTESCGLNLGISDNNCPNGQEFLISVEQQVGQVIGQDLDISSVELLLDHTWPPDLELRLTAPTGESALLARHNGNGNDDFGDLLFSDCSSPAIFSDNACLSISEFTPPFIGEFGPVESLRDNFVGVTASGIWKLQVCDRANGDIGILKGLKINFTDFLCSVPRDFITENIESDNVRFSWSDVDVCQNYKISYREIDAPLAETSTDFIECDENSFTVTGLEPNTTYTVTISTICDNSNESQASCPIVFTTACLNSSFTESFDALPLCDITCKSSCEISDIWNNMDTTTQWLINTGSTLSQRTGPNSDINGTGNYIYIENNLEDCNSEEAILESHCMTVNASGDCNISFYYHMFGREIESLRVDAQYGDGIWRMLWSISGNQGNQWNFTSIGIPQPMSVGSLRIVAERNQTRTRNDIAIDQIKLIGVDTISYLRYFVDNDSDGFGVEDNSILLCETNPPFGYADNADDCDDSNPMINPMAAEINCNLIDENCNGNSDDVSVTDLQYEVEIIEDESCLGLSDGSIELTVGNGQPPYTYLWSNGAETSVVNNLSSGIYFATLSDVGGCLLVTEPIFVGFNNTISYRVSSITSPSCNGLSDGSISILVDGGSPPYDVRWSPIVEGLVATDLKDGKYSASITDSNGCTTITDSIELISPQVITAGIAIHRDVDCIGGNDGFLQLGITGGTPPYSILWSNGETTVVNSQLEAGKYSVTISDNQGCENILENIIVSEPQALIVNIDNQEDVECADGIDGMIDISVDGGMPPYSYFWSDGTRTEDLLNVISGIYSLTVTDFNACNISISDISISEPTAISITIDNLSSVDCPGSIDGLIDVNVSGGVPSYTYNWSNTDGVDSQSNGLTDLSAGLYSLTVVDDLGCKSEALNFEIINRNRAINVRTELLASIGCFGDSTAVVMAEISNGQSPYDYNWSSGRNVIKNSIRDTLSNILKGNYNLTVTDDEGCTGVADFISITEPNEIVIDSVSLTSNLCWYETEGEIYMEAFGGTGELQYNWSNGGITAAIDNLINGEYNLTITDDNQCELILEDIVLSSHEAITFNTLIEDTNNQDGSIQLEILTGAMPLSYSWYAPPLQNDFPSINGLSPGTYSVVIEDIFGCVVDTSFTVGMISSVSNNENKIATLFPNPGDGKFDVIVESFEKVSISVFDIEGKSLYQTKRSSSYRYQEDIGHLPNGLYMILIKQDDQFESFKYLKI